MLQTAERTSSEQMFFVEEAARLGPNGQQSAWSLKNSQAYCRMWARRQAENFTVVSCMVPRRFRQDLFNIYAFCRWSDHLADEIPDAAERCALLDWWEGELEACFHGVPCHPVMIALRSTVRSRRIEKTLLLDLLSAFRQDQSKRRYASEQELLDYCRRSANPVGRILLQLADVHSGDIARLSDCVCTGLQLANFCQDMARDAAVDRIYAPSSLWARHDVSEALLLAGRCDPRLSCLLSEWVSSARGYLEEGWPIVHRLPNWLATDVELFIRGGTSILKNIEAAEFDVWTRRPTVTRTQKLGLLLQASCGRLFSRSSALAIRGTRKRA